MDQFFSLLIGYAFGCFLTADVVCRRLAGKPVFQVGVGNPGMANVGHELRSCLPETLPRRSPRGWWCGRSFPRTPRCAALPPPRAPRSGTTFPRGTAFAAAKA